MEGTTLNLQCNSCKNESTFEVSEALTGHKLTFQCKHCPKKLSYFYPRVNELSAQNTETAIGNSKSIVNRVFLQKKTKDSRVMEKYYLAETDNVLGRYSENNNKSSVSIKTDDRTMSREHCLIKCHRNSQGSLVCSIKDSGSTNGIILNEREMHPSEVVYLMHKDRIVLGNTILIYNEVYEA